MSMPKITKLEEDEDWTQHDLGGKRPDKSVCIVRYGGFGDMIQTALIAEVFKKKGWYVCWNVSDRGYEVVKTDPNVDEFFIQHKDAVLNKDLGAYWFKLSKLFDKFVNMSESVEGTLLAVEGRSPIYWTQKARHIYMNHNYGEFMCHIAGVPYNKEVGRFYPTEEEKKWAKKERKKFGKKSKVILWALTGTSYHKVNPWVDTVIARLLAHNPEIHVVLSGDEHGSKYLMGTTWKKEKRVHSFVKNPIRKTLAFIEEVDCVVGPETGVLNAAGALDTPTVLFCSHSNPNKVSRDWKNTISLEPKNCECYPCHILHYSNMYCNFVDMRDYIQPIIKLDMPKELYEDILSREIPIAKCSIMIDADMIYNAIIESLYRRKKSET